MSAIRFSVGGRVYPRFRIAQGNVYSWPLRGSGGATPVHITLDYRRHRMNWYFLASGRNSVFHWPSYGSGGVAPVATNTTTVWHLPGGFGRHSLRGKGYSQ